MGRRVGVKTGGIFLGTLFFELEAIPSPVSEDEGEGQCATA